MTEQPDAQMQQIVATWQATYPNGQVRPRSYDPEQGLLIVECVSYAYQFQTRLTGMSLAKKANAALGADIVRAVAAKLRDIRILVTGSRTWDDVQVLDDTLRDIWHDATQVFGPEHPVVIVHGDCRKGADFFARHWAVANDIRQEVHPADWTAPCAPECPDGHRLNRANGQTACPTAGPRRNEAMVQLGADILVAFQRDNSRGTADCIRRASQAGIPVRRITA
ncbi:SLOG family protein [Streptomyces sp. NPDC058092]|uniref:SLOG family protein n=1 Tax=Streptomyces sp. NPDC058092 TaxID=3346336 RepID=UPI0036E74C22